jgi:hypothetical protein
MDFRQFLASIFQKLHMEFDRFDRLGRQDRPSLILIGGHQDREYVEFVFFRCPRLITPKLLDPGESRRMVWSLRPVDLA